MPGGDVIGPTRVRLAVPWLAAAVHRTEDGRDDPVRCPTGEWLVGRAARTSADETDWRRWLVRETGLPDDALRRWPAGPCAHAARRGSLPSGTWAIARPVHVLAGLDRLRLAPDRLAIDAVEAQALCTDLTRHFEESGFRFHAGPDGDWLLECREPLECVSVEPVVAAGGDLRELLPAGRDGARVRSLQNEIQMLLHDRASTAGRDRSGAALVNSVWLWGFGAAAAPAPASLPTLYTDDAWLAGLWRAHGALPLALAQFAAGAWPPGTLLVGWSEPPAPDAREAVAVLEARCLAPLRAGLRAGRVPCVELLAGNFGCTTWRSDRWKFWRRPRLLAEAFG
jgi:hypothetical protein